MMRHGSKLNIRFMASLLALLLLALLLPAASAAETSGDCGDRLTWTLSGDTLTISGSGDMWDYTEVSMAPWYEYREQITSVRLPEGLTSVGNLAFYDCGALTAVFLPDTVSDVGRYAFAQCGEMVLLDLGDGIQSIGDAAFRDCASLGSVRLPDGLSRLGFQSFYRCESLTAVTIPASVTDWGMTSFAYCYGLLRADVRADVDTLPEWTFYGCENLTDLSLSAAMTGAEEYAFYGCDMLSSVSYTGSTKDRAQIEADIARDQAGSDRTVQVSDSELEKSSVGLVLTEVGESYVAQLTTTTETEHAAVSTTLTATYPDSTTGERTNHVQANITLEDSAGWSEAIPLLLEAVQEADTAKADVFLKADASVKDVSLEQLSGQTISVAFHDGSGSSWEVDCTTLEQEKKSTAIDLSCERSDATAEQLELLGCAAGYQIRFLNSAQVNAKVKIKLPAEHAYANALLYQVEGRTLKLLQTVVVDNQGFAQFYLACVDADTEYLIGIDSAGEHTESAIIPEALYAEYGVSELSSPVEYVITGRTSSWGMNINQVTWIMAGVLVVVVIAVGVTMFLLNRRKLKMGYVPDLDDAD